MGTTNCKPASCAVNGCSNHGCAFGKTAEADSLLIRASCDGDVDAIRKALMEGANVDAQLPILMRVEDEDQDEDSIPSDESSHVDSTKLVARSLTPLMYASNAGHLKAVELLLNFDARLDVHDPDGMQALHFAAQSGSAACFKALLRAGANPLVQDNFGCDALDYVPIVEISCGPMKQEWLALLKGASVLSLAGADGVGVAIAEEIDAEVVPLPVRVAPTKPKTRNQPNQPTQTHQTNRCSQTKPSWDEELLCQPHRIL